MQKIQKGNGTALPMICTIVKWFYMELYIWFISYIFTSSAQKQLDNLDAILRLKWNLKNILGMLLRIFNQQPFLKYFVKVFLNSKVFLKVS